MQNTGSVDTRSSYSAPCWLPGGNTQTLWPLLIKGPRPALVRERWATPDGDFIDVDRLPEEPGRPRIVLFHGLEGSSGSHYARALMRAARDRRWNGMVVHFRGCSGEPNRLPRAYHSGDAGEIAWILEKVAAEQPSGPLHAVGVSLGGNALLCWLGSQSAKACEILKSAVAVSVPLDLAEAGHHLARGFNRLYTRHFLKTMRRSAAAKARLFPGAFDAERAARARNLYEFDDAYTAPLHGYRSADDYWQRASSKGLLEHIEVPTLVLNAKNDPFLPRNALPGVADVSSAVTLEQPEEGGHVGFVTGPFPGRLDWLPQRVLAFFEEN